MKIFENLSREARQKRKIDGKRKKKEKKEKRKKKEKKHSAQKKFHVENFYLFSSGKIPAGIVIVQLKLENLHLYTGN